MANTALQGTLDDSFPQSSTAAVGRVETAAVDFLRSRAGVSWRSQSAQEPSVTKALRTLALSV